MPVYNIAIGGSQEFATGDKGGGLGTEVPPAGYRGRALVGVCGRSRVWGRSPQKPETNATTGDMHICPPWLRH